MTELQHVLRQPQLFGGEDVCGNYAEDAAGTLSIEEGVGAETRETGNLVGKIGIVPLGELLAILLGHDRREQRFDVIHAKHRLGRIERLHVAVLAENWWRPHAQMEVGRLRRAHRMKQPIDQGWGTHRSATSRASTM